MKRALIISSCVIGLATAAQAQGGGIFITSDEAGYDYYFVDNGGLIEVYVWHGYTLGATASEWMLDVTDAGWTYLGDMNNFQLVIGTSITGVAIAYEACLANLIRLMTVNFYSATPAPDCTGIRIVPAPGKSYVRAVDCAENSVYAAAGAAIVNVNQTCRIDPVESTTWGQVKALYR